MKRYLFLPRLFAGAFLAAALPALTTCFSIKVLEAEPLRSFSASRASLSGAGEFSEISGLRIIPPLKPGRRPLPISPIQGKGYDDLLFYARSNTAADIRTPEEIFRSLSGGRVIADNDTLMTGSVSGTRYGSAEKIAVSDMPFTQAWQVTVTEVPRYSWDFQLELPGLRNSAFSHGDIMLLVITMKTINTRMEDGDGKIQCIVEQPVAPNSKALMGTAFAPADEEGWFTIYLPFSAVDGYTRLCVRLGFGVQTVQFGGYQIINYRRGYTLDQLPSSGTTDYSEGWKVFDKDSQWRRDAWTRIERIRKGDINVIVKDAAGNPVEGVQVYANMYDHEFKWGTAVNPNIVNRDRYRNAASLFFNTAVMESEHKWTIWENNPAAARNQYNAVNGLGFQYVRGHVFMWDRSTSIPKRVYDLYLADVANGNRNNKAAIDAAIRTHISSIAAEYRDQVYVWDVVNEVMNNADMQNYYGRDMLKDWFAWARQGAGQVCLLFINETGITRTGSSLDKFKTILNWMRDNNVDFDGIGIQGHFGNTMVSPESFYNMLEELNEYNKFIEITEFDMGSDVSESDREFESSFTRDIMIAAFSQVNTIGFTMWGFTSASHWHSNAPILDREYNLKESGKQYIDLVYNKWWTNEYGLSDDGGTFNFRGFYGDYDITVSVGGKIKTVEAGFYKGKDNTVTVMLEDYIVDMQGTVDSLE